LITNTNYFPTILLARTTLPLRRITVQDLRHGVTSCLELVEYLFVPL